MKSIKWKILHSLWIIPAFIPLLNGFPFIYAGSKVKKKLWIIVGIIISADWALETHPLFLYGADTYTVGPIPVILWILGMIYVFIVLREYLIRLEAIEETKNDYRERIFNEYRTKSNAKNNINNPDPHDKNNELNELSDSDSISNRVNEVFNQNIINNESNSTITDEISDLNLIDINKDSVEMLSNLPGINIVLAKKIVDMRFSGYEFNSVEDLAEKLNLKPHIMEKIRPLVKFSKRKKNNIFKGRRIDI